jgi:hypothetical protein
MVFSVQAYVALPTKQNGLVVLKINRFEVLQNPGRPIGTPQLIPANIPSSAVPTQQQHAPSNAYAQHTPQQGLQNGSPTQPPTHKPGAIQTQIQFQQQQQQQQQSQQQNAASTQGAGHGYRLGYQIPPKTVSQYALPAPPQPTPTKNSVAAAKSSAPVPPPTFQTSSSSSQVVGIEFSYSTFPPTAVHDYQQHPAQQQWTQIGSMTFAPKATGQQTQNMTVANIPATLVDTTQYLREESKRALMNKESRQRQPSSSYPRYVSFQSV